MSGEGFRLRRELKDDEAREARMARLEELEQRVFEQASQVLEAALSFHEVSPTQTEPPPQWVTIYGEIGAKQRLEVAKTGWLPQSIAPNALKLAQQFVAGSLRGRARNVRIGIGTVNATIALPAPTTREHPGGPVYPVKDLDE